MMVVHVEGFKVVLHFLRHLIHLFPPITSGVHAYLELESVEQMSSASVPAMMNLKIRRVCTLWSFGPRHAWTRWRSIVVLNES